LLQRPTRPLAARLQRPAGPDQADEEIIMPTYRTLTPLSEFNQGGTPLTTDMPRFRALDIRGASKDAFAPAIIYPKDEFLGGGGDNQKFELRLTGEHDTAGNPFVWIIAKHSGMALTVPFSPRFDKGVQVFQQPLITNAPGGEGDVQKWLQTLAFTDTFGTNFFIYANKWSSLVLDVQGSVMQDGTPVIQWSQTNNDNQLWVPSPEI
jgi:hypothetical protein